MAVNVYINLEDDVKRISARLKKTSASEVVLVCPKRCYLFSDSINLRLLKKQADLLNKQVAIMTMDEKGQAYAKEAGFALKLPPHGKSAGLDMGFSKKVAKEPEKNLTASKSPQAKALTQIVKEFLPAVKTPKIRINENLFPKGELAGLAKGSFQDIAHKRLVWGFSLLSGAIVLIVVFLVLPSAKITLYPKTELLTRDVEISTSVNLTQPDADRLVMPALALDRTLELRDKFSSTGKKEVGSKAAGRVAIFNLTGTNLNLKQATTVLTAGGKNYLFTEDQAQIRPTPGKNQSSDLSNWPNLAEVAAELGGESYNLPAGTRLEINNQIFGSRPQLLFAKTATPITGGNSRFISTVTANDLSQAQSRLTAAMLEQLRAGLKGRSQVLVDDAFVSQTLEFASDKPADTEAPNFEASEKLRLTGLLINSADLQALIRQRVVRTLSDNKRLQDPGLDNLVIKVKSADLSNGLLSLLVHFESKATASIDSASLAQAVAGKTKAEASEVLLSYPEIDKVDILLSPGWQNSLPRFTAKIKLEVVK